MAPSWSQTPDLCLLAIFKHIPLSDLLRNISLVCSNWSRLQRDELVSRRVQTKVLVLVQNYARHLKLIQQRENSFGSQLIEHVRREDGSTLVNIRSVDQIRFDALLVPGDGVLREVFVSPLMNILVDSNITQLTLVQRDLSRDTTILALEQMTRLINQFSTSLVSLKVDVFFLNNNYGNRNEFHTNVIALFNSINQLNSLRHLTLNGNFPDLRQLSLPILNRLTTFTTNRFEPTHLLTTAFRQITTNVRINCDIQLHLFELPAFDAELAAKFSLIRVKEPLSAPNIPTVQQLGFRLVNLASLELTIDSMPMTSIAQCLVLQTELVHLKLDFGLRVPRREEHIAMVRPITQLPSVRLLTLSFRTETHLDTERLHVPEIFPNLQVVHLSLYTRQCTECKFDVKNGANQAMDFAELRPRIEHCIRLTRQPFRRCHNLNTIKFEAFGPLQSFVPQGLITLDQL